MTNWNKYMNDLAYESHVNSDPTYRFFLREAKFDSNNFEHQLKVKCSVALIAIATFIDKKYPKS